MLFAVIVDALFSAPTVLGGPRCRLTESVHARGLLLRPSPSLAVICEMIGFDPIAVRERVQERLSTAATPEALIAAPRDTGRKKKQIRRTGVGRDFGRLKGTGGGGRAHIEVLGRPENLDPRASRRRQLPRAQFCLC